MTLSFYAKSASQNSGHVYSIQIRKYDPSDNRKYVLKPFTVTDSWQRFSFTFIGDTAQSISDGTTNGMELCWHLSSGPDDLVSETSTWASSDKFQDISGQNNFMDNTSNYFYLTGVQLEIGSQATAFEHRSFNEELTLCQRYYQSHKYGGYIGFNFIVRKSGNNTVVVVTHGIPPMRAAATGTFTGAFKLYRITDGTTASPTGMNVIVIDDTFFNAVKFTGSTTSFSTGNMCTVFTSATGGQYDLDAEM